MVKLENNWINKFDAWWESLLITPTEWVQIIGPIIIIGCILWVEYKELKNWGKKTKNERTG